MEKEEIIKYKLDDWNILYGNEKKFYLSYHIDRSGWWQKDFESFEQIKDFLKTGCANIYVHLERGNDMAKWIPVTLEMPILYKESQKKRIGDLLYEINKPIFRGIEKKWIYRAYVSNLVTGKSDGYVTDEIDEEDLIKMDDISDSEICEFELERWIKEYYRDDYSDAEIGILYFVRDIVDNDPGILKMTDRLDSEDKKKKYVAILTEMRDKVFREIENRK